MGLWLECGVVKVWTAGLDGVELLQLEVFELESGGWKETRKVYIYFYNDRIEILTGNGGVLIRGCGCELFLFLFLVREFMKFFVLLDLPVVGEKNAWPKKHGMSIFVTEDSEKKLLDKINT